MIGNIIHVKSITKVHELLGLEKPDHPLVTVIFYGEREVNQDFGGVSYVLDFYQISFKNGFAGSIGYGRNHYDFEEGSLVFTKPGQVIQIEDGRGFNENTGWSLLFHPDLIRKSGLSTQIKSYSFFDYDIMEALHLSDREKKEITDLVRKIKHEYSNNIDKHSQELIVGNIEMLLKYSNRYYDRQFYTRTGINKDILSKLDDVIQSYYDSEQPMEKGVLTVRYCANRLNLSVNYLGDLIKNLTGRSAKDHINNFVIEEAKTKLLASRDSIAQIAFSLGYEYPQGFNKLFKMKVGESPSSFRRLNE